MRRRWRNRGRPARQPLARLLQISPSSAACRRETRTCTQRFWEPRVTALAAVVALAAAPAEAQRRDGWGVGGYDAGYRDGARAGGDDARDGRAFEYQRHRDYRSADRGYSNRDGRRDAYADQYRAGFVAGYRDGYYSGGGRGSGMGRRVPVPRYGPAPGVRRPTGFPGVSDDIGYANGFEEGYKPAWTTAATATATIRAATAATATPIRATAATTDREASTR